MNLSNMAVMKARRRNLDQEVTEKSHISIKVTKKEEGDTHLREIAKKRSNLVRKREKAKMKVMTIKNLLIQLRSKKDFWRNN